MAIFEDLQSSIYPVVGILICVYTGDDASNFRVALDSLKAQTYPQGRIRIYLGVDGKVSSAIEDIISSRGNFFHEISRSQRNIGLAQTLNRLILLSKDCDYVARMDADDISLPERISKQISYMSQNPDVDILGGSIIEFHKSNYFEPRIFPRKDHVLKTISRASPLAHPTVVFRRSALDRLGYYPDVRGNEDIAMWFKALHLGLVIDNVPESVLYFRVTKKMLARRGFKKASGEFWVYMIGIRSLRLGLLENIFPVLRFVYRLMPSPLSYFIFRSVGLRNRVQQC